MPAVLHVVAPARVGGLESVLRSLATGQARRRQRVCVVAVLSPEEEEHPLVTELEDSGVDVRTVFVGARDYRGERREVGRIMEQFRPDVVHTHGFRSDVVDGEVARRQGWATVSTCHGFIERNWRGRLYQWAQRRALRRFDAVIAVATPIAERLRAAGVPPAITHLVPNAFVRRENALSSENARNLLGIPPGPVVGWVGRLSHEKGPDVALDAFARMGVRDARLVVIGGGRDVLMLRRRAVALGIGARVLWCGEVPNAGRLFSAFDVFLLSSRTEGTPMALLEAIGAGVPVVATRVGGVPDLVDESCARLVNSDDEAAMAAALTAVLEAPKEARSRAAHARSRLTARYSLEPWLRRHDEVYRLAITSARRRDRRRRS